MLEVVLSLSSLGYNFTHSPRLTHLPLLAGLGTLPLYPCGASILHSSHGIIITGCVFEAAVTSRSWLIEVAHKCMLLWRWLKGNFNHWLTFLRLTRAILASSPLSIFLNTFYWGPTMCLGLHLPLGIWWILSYPVLKIRVRLTPPLNRCLGFLDIHLPKHSASPCTGLPITC